MSRIIRINPITGEELHYYKGAANSAGNVDNQAPNHHRFPRADSVLNYTASSPVNKPDEAKSIVKENYSMVANAGSIPLLNFNELGLNDEPSQFKKELNKITNRYKDLKSQNPIVGPILQERSARPKSSYRHGYENSNSAFESPIMAYQQNQASAANNSALKSQLEAPRNDLKITDSELIASLQKPLVEKKNSIYSIERVADLERLWINSSAITERANLLKPNENEEKHKALKENMVLNTILTDQLNDPFKDSPQIKTVYTSRGNKFNLIDTRNNSTLMPSALTENMLSKRCKFNCRVRSVDGKLALRELFGIFFLYDGSLTIYEFRLLCGAYFTAMSGGTGSKANALPFIARKCYKHAFGRRKDMNIDIWDLFKGSVLYLACDIAGEKGYLELEVTEINEADKESLLTTAELQNSNLSSVEITRNIQYIKDRLRAPYTDIELNDQSILKNVRKFMCAQIEQRAVEVYMNLASSLKNRSKRHGPNGLVAAQDLYDALNEFKIQIHTEDLNIASQVLDFDSTGFLHYSNIMSGFFGEMNILRHKLFRALIHKLDTLKSGFVQINDIYKYYKANFHPKVKSGDLTENQMFEKFLSSFELINPKSQPDFYRLTTTADTKSLLISYEQLEQYYNGLSIVIESDQDFVQILKNSWNVN